MLAMGRALMGAPRLLMLDEPSLGLAPIIVADIFRTIGELRAAGVSVLLVEQNAQAALKDRRPRLCDGAKYHRQDRRQDARLYRRLRCLWRRLLQGAQRSSRQNSASR
jgi:ABC-type branched-subunit amino acid transport system ATPase component